MPKTINFENKKMIQRLQTVFLIVFVLLSIANGLFFPVEIIVFQPLDLPLGDQINNLSFVLVFFAVLSIFSFKKRIIQLRLNGLIWLIHVLFWGSFVFLVVRDHAGAYSNFFPDVILAGIAEVNLLLANKFIRKDEALVRSLDRLR